MLKVGEDCGGQGLKNVSIYLKSELITEACSAERVLASARQDCVADKGDFGERLRVPALLNTPLATAFCM